MVLIRSYLLTVFRRENKAAKNEKTEANDHQKWIFKKEKKKNMLEKDRKIKVQAESEDLT